MFNKILKKIEEYRVFRKTFNELNKLSDRELNDIGISRFNIVDIAKKEVGWI